VRQQHLDREYIRYWGAYLKITDLADAALAF
jgi:hypothetical protein